MPDPRITVAIPVGPKACDRNFLEACLTSVREQTRRPNEILLIDDMAGLAPEDVKSICVKGDRLTAVSKQECWRGGDEWQMTHDVGDPSGRHEASVRIWLAPWRMGVGQAFNCGVALARNDLVLMLGADDWLEPECIEKCLLAYARQREDSFAYYYLSVRYHAEEGFSIPPDLADGIQTLPCNAAMVTKALWKHTGGFPPEVGSGAPDAALVSTLLGNQEAVGKLIPVEEGVPLYNVRIHGGQDTLGRAPWQRVIIETRNLLTAGWQQPEWGRYE